MKNNVYIYILIMAVVTYLIRVLPLVLIKKEIENKFIRSFLHYVPYVTLAAMTFPAILYATSSPASGIIGLATAVVLALFGRSLFTVSSVACVVVFLSEFFIN
ncbi:MAG: AzlD domain-containing protein [Clostridia bacterium]|nr:AzlD domain-containing protein [Clostridia bacterium]